MALIVPSAISIWPYIKQSDKSLQFRVLAITPIGPSQAKGFGNLRLLHGEHAIDTPYLAAIKITNTGDVDIRPEDFVGPINLRVTTGKDLFSAFYGIRPFEATAPALEKLMRAGVVRVVDARVAEVDPPNLPVTLSIKGDSVQVAPLLLNRGEAFVVEMLASGGTPRVQVEGRIAGIRSITEAVAAPIYREKIFAVVMLVFTSFLSLFTGFAVWVSRRDPKSGGDVPFVSRPLIAAVIFYGSAMIVAALIDRLRSLLELDFLATIGVLAGIITAAVVAVALINRR